VLLDALWVADAAEYKRPPMRAGELRMLATTPKVTGAATQGPESRPAWQPLGLSIVDTTALTGSTAT